MSDLGDDLECLKIHLESRLNDTSDSGDDNSLDEEYYLLRPSPIPAEIIREKSIYRPPSPVNDVFNKKNISSELYGSIKGDDQERNMSAVKEKKNKEMNVVVVNEIISDNLQIAEKLIKVQSKIISCTEKLSLAYLEILEKFQFNLNFFGNLLENFKIKKLSVIQSVVPAELLENLKNTIDDICVLLSYLYAFLFSEYLFILNEADKMRKSKINPIVVKTLQLIENTGEVDEIEKIIHLRSFKKVSIPICDNLVPVQFSNQDIISRLKLLSPKIEKNQRRIQKKKKTKNVKLEAVEMNRRTRIKKLTGNTEITKVIETEDLLNESKRSQQNSNVCKNEGDIKNSHVNENVHQIVSENIELSKYLSKFDTSSKIFVKMNHKEMKTVITSIAMIMKAINVMNILQYTMDTVEMRNFKYVIILLNDCLKILKNISNYNKLLNVLCPIELVKSMEAYYIPISELFVAHSYAYISHFCYVFMKELRKQIIENSEELSLQIIKVIESLGNFQYIQDRLQFRNDELYIELAQKICLLTPTMCTLSSNKEILRELLQVNNFSEDISSFKLNLESNLLNRNEVLKVVINTILHQKCHKIEDLHLDLKQIEILSILQDQICHEHKDTEVNSLFENMKNFLIYLEELEKLLESEVDNDSIVNNLLANAKKVDFSSLAPFTVLTNIFNKQVLRIFVSHFYSFFLFVLNKHYKTLNSNAAAKQTNNFHVNLIEEMISFCPLQKLSEKLEFRNDESYKIYMKILLNKEGVVVAKSSCDILNEALQIFKEISNANADRTALSTKYLKELSFTVSSPTKRTRRLHKKKKKILESIESPKLIQAQNSSKDREEIEENSKMHYVDDMKHPKYITNFEASSNIFNEMNHEEMDAVIVSINFIAKAINVMNILQYTMDTFEIKHMKSVITLLNNCSYILKSVFNYNKSLIDLCAKNIEKSVDEYYIPLSDLFVAHCYAYILHFGCVCVKALRNQDIQDNSEGLNLQVVKIIESLGTFEFIHRKLQFRNDSLYIELAQKVSSSIPVTCTPSNVEIFQELSQIGKFSEDITSFDFDLETYIQSNNKVLQTVINAILPRNSIEVEGIQFNSQKIAILSNIQSGIYHSIEYTLEVNVLFENMHMLVALLEQLENEKENEVDNDSGITEVLINAKYVNFNTLATPAILDKILHQLILKIFVSHFYCFYLFIFVKAYEFLRPSANEEKQSNLHHELLEKLISFCSLQKLAEKLKFRNDAIYKKYMKMLLDTEGVVVAKSTWDILNEALQIFKVISNNDTGYRYACLSAQLEEFQRGALWTKTLINNFVKQNECVVEFENSSCIAVNVFTEKDEKEKRKKKTESVTAIESGVDFNCKVNQLLQACAQSEIRSVIINFMKKPKVSDFVINSVIRKVEISIIRAKTVFKVLSKSLVRFEKRNSLGTYESLLDCVRLVDNLEKFSKLLLSVSASSKLKEMETFVLITNNCLGDFHSQIISCTCLLITALRFGGNYTENEIYPRLWHLLESFGSDEEVSRKLNYTSDEIYKEMLKELNVLTSLSGSANNNPTEPSTPYSKSEILNKNLNKEMWLRNFQSKFEGVKLDLKKLKIIMYIQHDIHFHDQFPTNFPLTFENIINFFINLKNFENQENKISANGNFVDKFINNSENILSKHISRILVAQFYSFIFSSCVEFLKKLPELVQKKDVSFFQEKLVNLFSSNCSIEEVFNKMKFRNHTIYSQYIGDFLKMKIIEVDKSCEEIYSEVVHVMNMNRICTDNNISSDCVNIDTNVKDPQSIKG